MLTFIATVTRSVSDAQLERIGDLVRGTRFHVTRGKPGRNQPTLVLCFDGPREQADQTVVEAFRKIVTDSPTANLKGNP